MAKYQLEEFKTAEQIHEEEMNDPAYREEWHRTAFARAISELVVHYRAEHGLTQSRFGKLVGLTQANVSRLEGGDHNPSLETLARLAQILDIEIVVDVAPANRKRAGLSQVANHKRLTEFELGKSRVLVAAV